MDVAIDRLELGTGALDLASAVPVTADERIRALFEHWMGLWSSGYSDRRGLRPERMVPALSDLWICELIGERWFCRLAGENVRQRVIFFRGIDPHKGWIDDVLEPGLACRMATLMARVCRRREVLYGSGQIDDFCQIAGSGARVMLPLRSAGSESSNHFDCVIGVAVSGLEGSSPCEREIERWTRIVEADSR